MKPVLLFFIACCQVTYAQDFADYRIRYGHLEANDPAAFEFLNPYISKAKRENNTHELFQAYKDAVYFTSDYKLRYADSALSVALKSGDSMLIATAHLTKGTVYYFKHRKFQPALDEYLMAWRFTRKSEDRYLYYKNQYHFGVVKTYLGYYDDALVLFQECRAFFESAHSNPEPPNVKHNRIKAYLNTLHQTAVCMIETGDIRQAEDIANRGLTEIGTQRDFYLERSYFFKILGITAFREGQYSSVIPALDNALPALVKKDDFTNASVVYFYKGKAYARMGHSPLAMDNFRKVDSVFSKYDFILPEVRESYEYLIDFYDASGDRSRELYYTKQLIKADRILMTDFKNLFPKIHREYDTPELLRRQQKIENPSAYGSVIGWVIAALAAALAAFLLLRKKTESVVRELKAREQQVCEGGAEETNEETPTLQESSTKVPDKVAQAVLTKLERLEKRNFFLDSSMTLHKLAPVLNTNSTYLSTIIREYRGCSYHIYIRTLRMQYVTKKLREDKDWRSFTVQNLAKACGMEDRASFTNAFVAYNKMKPAEFVNKIRQERADANRK